MEGLTIGESVIINSIMYGMKDHFVVFVNNEIGYNAIVQIRYGNASVVYQTHEYYTFSAAPSSDELTITRLYDGERRVALSYMPI